MPLFQVNYQDARKSPAMAAPMAYQQTDALLADMEAQAQALDLRQQEMDLSVMRADQFRQTAQQSMALDQAEFDAGQAWNAMKSRQAAHQAWSDQGHLAQFWDPADRQSLEGMDASEPGYWDLFNQGTIRAQQGYAQAQLRGMLDEAKALGVDKQVQGYLQAGDAEGAGAALKEARQAATRKGAVQNWTSSISTPYRAALDEQVRMGAITPNQQLSAYTALAQLEQLGTQDIREGTMDQIRTLQEELAVATAPPLVAQKMQQLQQQNEMLTARLAGATSGAASSGPPAPQTVPTFDQATDDKAKELMAAQDELRALEEEAARREALKPKAGALTSEQMKAEREMMRRSTGRRF